MKCFVYVHYSTHFIYGYMASDKCRINPWQGTDASSFFGPLDTPSCMIPCSWWAPRLQPSQPYGYCGTGKRGNSLPSLRGPLFLISSMKEGNVLFNDALNAFYLRLYGVILFTVIWLRTILIVRKETRCRHIGYSLRLTARVLLYASSHRPDNTYHGLCYTSRGALAGTRNSSMVYIK